MALGRLEYLYTPSRDVAGDLRYMAEVLGGETIFAIEDGGVRVAMAKLGEGPAILLTDHLEGDRPIHVYAVEDLSAAVAEVEAGGATRERTVKLPPGPAATFRSPSGLRFALYEPTRPFVVES